MALSTATLADDKATEKWFQSAVAHALQRQPKGAEIPFQFRYTISSTEIDNADDRVRLLEFPSGYWITRASVWVEDELDTGVDALVWDLITEDSAGTADSRKLISGATAGQGAGEGVDMDAGGAVYVGDRFLVFDTTTAAATAASGDIVVTLWISYGMATTKLPSLTFDAV